MDRCLKRSGDMHLCDFTFQKLPEPRESTLSISNRAALEFHGGIEFIELESMSRQLRQAGVELASGRLFHRGTGAMGRSATITSFFLLQVQSDALAE